MKSSKLSTREREVLETLFSHNTNEAIANELGISINTVKTHLKHIFRKLNVHSRTELIIKLKGSL